MNQANTKFFRPSVIWLGVWLAIFFTIWQISSWQHDLYWRDNQNTVGKLEEITVQTIFPYAAAYLEQQGQPDLLQQILNADLGPFALVLTDAAGKIKGAPQNLPAGPIEASCLKDRQFFIIYKNPVSHPALDGPFAERTLPPAGGGVVLGRLYLVPKEHYSLKKTLEQAYGQILTPAGSVFAFTLLSYMMVLVGFGAICAITARFQSHFQEVRDRHYESELEARELRIQVLESNIKSVELRLQLLDRKQEKAQTILNAARNTIAGLESAILYESNRNEELKEQLRKAEGDRDEATTTIQSIELDREKIAKELKELEAMREVEAMNYPEATKEKSRRPKEFLWLNMVYKNLYFSRRAVQNIIELQNSHDIFPSLPDALASLNNSGVESLANGGALPSRSVVRYTQPLAHYTGELWEYRFSKDGRIFFGLSKAKTWNIDTILLKRNFSLNRYKYEHHLEQTLGKDNDDLKSFH